MHTYEWPTNQIRTTTTTIRRLNRRQTQMHLLCRTMNDWHYIKCELNDRKNHLLCKSSFPGPLYEWLRSSARDILRALNAVSASSNCWRIFRFYRIEKVKIIHIYIYIYHTVSTSFRTLSSSDDEPGIARSTSETVCCENSNGVVVVVDDDVDERTWPEFDRFGVPDPLLSPLTIDSSAFSCSTTTRPAS